MRTAGRQRGASLLFALLALGALSLAALALVRSIDTGSLIVGNIGFKQAATAGADQATQAAIAVIQNVAATRANLNADQTAKGYYASSVTALDATGQQVDASHAQIDWQDGNGCKTPNLRCITAAPTPIVLANSGGTANYVITRLCTLAADPNATGNSCAVQVLSKSSSAYTGAVSYANPRDPTTVISPFYRVIVRVVGARGTTSFTETTVRF